MEKLPKINIIYEDNHLLVVEKPVNIPVQEDISQDIDMITLLKKYRIKKENKKHFVIKNSIFDIMLKNRRVNLCNLL